MKPDKKLGDLLYGECTHCNCKIYSHTLSPDQPNLTAKGKYTKPCPNCRRPIYLEKLR